MHEVRSQLKDLLVPQLRLIGFKGSFPHFRRERNERNELITIQLDKYGTGQFVIELASAPTGIFTTYWGKEIPQSKLTAHDLADRYRLGCSSGNDSWFSIENESDNAVSVIIKMLESEGNDYFDSFA